MAIELQSKTFLLASITALLLFFPVNTVVAQISVNSTSGFEISFTQDQTTIQSSRGTVGLWDGDFSTFFNGTQSNLSSFTTQIDQQNGYFFVDDAGGTALGKYYYHDDDFTLISVALSNQTDQSFDALSVAFDFIYLTEDISMEQLFGLSYRVNGGEWRSLSEGVFSTEYLQGEEPGWNSFSIQLTLDDFFVRPGDDFEFRWQATEGSAEEYMPIALQKIDLTPNAAEQKSLRPGTLIITEILPQYIHEEYSAEYLEIFNTSSKSLNLKGLTIQQGGNEVVVQQDIYIEPYETFLFGQKGEADLPLEFHYNYYQPVITVSSGRVRLMFDDREVAGASYESPEPGVALEIDHMGNAYDGYSGLNNLQPSSVELTPFMYGSPGKIDREKQIYEKRISEPGWYFFHAPGRLSTRNRSLDVDVFSIDGEHELQQRSIRDLQERSPFWAYLDEEISTSIYSEGTAAEPGFDLRAMEAGSGHLSNVHLIGNPISKPLRLSHFVNETDNQIYPAMLSWNNDDQRFSLLYDEDDIIHPWSGLIVPALSETTRINILEGSSNRENRLLDSYLSFLLSKELGNNRFTRVDESTMIGFGDPARGYENEMFHLPKLWPLQNLDNQPPVQPLLYLANSRSQFEANSFLQMPVSLDEPVQIALGTYLDRDNQRYRISWNQIHNLPEEWRIELIDTRTDDVINMREHLNYTFRGGKSDFANGMELPKNSFNFVEAKDNDFLFIRISPGNLYYRSTKEEERSDSVNLRQNYPNPFNPATTISFYLPETSFVRLGIYNVVGQQVALLREENLSEGEHTEVWNAADMPSGIYIIQLEAQNSVHTRKMTLIK